MNVQKINWPNALRDLSDYLDAVTERAEYDEARAEELDEENERLTERVADLTEENARLEQEIKILRANVDDLDEALAESGGRALELLIENARLRAAPRVIRPDEVRVGQKVVFSNHHNKNDWIVEDVDWGTLFTSDYNGTIILLRDTPEDEGEDFPCCRKGER